MKANEGMRKAPNTLWSGIHHASGLPVSVAYRADRVMLVSLYFEKKQICQAPAARFSKEQVESLMVRIAKDFAAGELQKNELFATRDARAKEMGVNLKSRGSSATPTMKRPAAAPSAPPAAKTTRTRASAPPEAHMDDEADKSETETIETSESEAGERDAPTPIEPVQEPQQQIRHAVNFWMRDPPPSMFDHLG